MSTLEAEWMAQNTWLDYRNWLHPCRMRNELGASWTMAVGSLFILLAGFILGRAGGKQ